MSILRYFLWILLWNPALVRWTELNANVTNREKDERAEGTWRTMTERKSIKNYTTCTILKLHFTFYEKNPELVNVSKYSIFWIKLTLFKNQEYDYSLYNTRFHIIFTAVEMDLLITLAQTKLKLLNNFPKTKRFNINTRTYFYPYFLF